MLAFGVLLGCQQWYFASFCDSGKNESLIISSVILFFLYIKFFYDILSTPLSPSLPTCHPTDVRAKRVSGEALPNLGMTAKGWGCPLTRIGDLLLCKAFIHWLKHCVANYQAPPGIRHGNRQITHITSFNLFLCVAFICTCKFFAYIAVATKMTNVVKLTKSKSSWFLTSIVFSGLCSSYLF